MGEFTQGNVRKDMQIWGSAVTPLTEDPAVCKVLGAVAKEWQSSFP